MSLGSSIAIAGAFIGTALAIFANPEIGSDVFFAPMVAAMAVAFFDK